MLDVDPPKVTGRRRPPRWRAAVLATACSLSAAALFGFAQGAAESARPLTGEVLEQARARQLEQLHLTIGRFVTGEAAVYEGELAVTERRRGRGARRLPGGRVVAALIRDEARSGELSDRFTLTIVSADHAGWLRLSQSPAEPGVTRSTPLRSVRATASLAASCADCLDDLSARPPVLPFRRLTAVGPPGGAAGADLRIEISGSLLRVEPDDLRLADLERLDPGFEALLEDEAEPFTRRGDEAIRRVEREIRELAQTPPDAPPQTRCERITRYSAERFVDLTDLRSYGVRDLTLLGTEICCFDHGGHGGDHECTREGGR
jgi:hypothetical protein